MNAKDFSIRLARKTYRTLFHKTFLNPACDCDRQSSNDKIFALLSTGKPCMIARFGTVEINCINNYLCIHNPAPMYKKVWQYLTENTHTPWWYTPHFLSMCNNAGIFPPTQDTAERFSERYLQDIPEIDLLGCHQYYERYMPLRQDVVRVQLEMLFPFFVDRPWTRYLRGKRVLVIHPFVETFRAQYAQRSRLFSHPDILPDFTLLTFPAVQSIAGNNSHFHDWFEALHYQEEAIANIDFDVALIGCGAYGLPLAATVKRMGRQSIHLGGGTQLLFGVKGQRWLQKPYLNTFHYRPDVDIDVNYQRLFNEYWVFPSTQERPANFQHVEQGCYW